MRGFLRNAGVRVTRDRTEQELRDQNAKKGATWTVLSSWPSRLKLPFTSGSCRDWADVFGRRRSQTNERSEQ